MPLSEAQTTISKSERRFRVAVCGRRRFGKTFLSIRELARFASQPERTCWYIAPTRSQGKGLVWEQLKERLGSLKWIAKTNESELTMTLVNGSEISIRSADAYDRMRGYSVDFAVFDEFADMDENVWTAVRPTLSDREGHAFFIGTPKGGKSSWAHDIYSMSAEYPDHWESFSYTTIDGGRVSEEELELARQDLDEFTFKQEYLANWVDSANQVYYAFDRQNNVKKCEIEDRSVIYVGMDFNISPMSAVVAVRYGDVLHIVDEIKMFSSNTDEMVDELKSRYSKSKIWVYPDPACRQRRSSAGGRTDLTILQNAGFVVKAPNSHTPIRDRINAVNSKIKNAKGQITLFFEPHCKGIITGLEKQTYKDGTSQPDKDNDYNHQLDALGYMVDYLFPVARDRVIERKPTRWTHQITA